MIPPYADPRNKGWQFIAPPRLTRAQKKGARRREQRMRWVMVRYAGEARLCCATSREIKLTTAQARLWDSRRPIRVPRRLRKYLGRSVGGLSLAPSEWSCLLRGTRLIATYVAYQDESNDPNSR